MGDTLLREKGSVKMENVEEVKRKGKGKESRFGKRYGLELKLRCVKLRLEEGLPVSLLSKEAGVSKDVIYRWVKAYQERGEAGLRNQVRSSESRRKLPGPVREFLIRWRLCYLLGAILKEHTKSRQERTYRLMNIDGMRSGRR
jgi:transposase-like protein